jgi:cellulose synthase (UDP-forming)
VLAMTAETMRQRMPSIPVGDWPTESHARTLVIRLVAVIALLITAGYLGWRLAGTIDPRIWWLSVPLFVVEVHNAFGLVLYTVALWDARRPPAWQPGEAGPRRVAVLIPTYNEPVEILLPTVAASVALKPGHETWVLDDGDRPAVRRLARDLGARYLARSDRSHAKAGNLNHALGQLDAEIVAVLDADHVPSAGFLTHTLPYFADPAVALVQTPQSFYNLESFEHERRGEGYFNEEAVFYRVIGPAKNRWAAPFWCGTSALVRTAALRSVGGVATDSVTEDIHTTIRMYRRGWRGVYHNEILANGLAPADASAYLGQRNRWAAGAMQVLRLENPLFGRGLRFGQRLAFLTTLFGWFDSWRMLAYMVIPVAVIFSGASPIRAPGAVYGPFFLLTLGIQFIALRLLARGHYPPILSMLFEVLRMPAVLPATLTLLRPDVRQPFRVTPKGRTTRRGAEVPALLLVLAGASGLALAWLMLTAVGATGVHYAEPMAAVGAGCFAAMNLGLLVAAISRIRAARFAGERRASVRFDVALPARLSGRKAEAVDVSLTGAQIALPAMPKRLAAHPLLRLDAGGTQVALRCHTRRVRQAEDGSVLVGVEFGAGQRGSVAALALALFGTGDGRWRSVVVAPDAARAMRPVLTSS